MLYKLSFFSRTISHSKNKINVQLYLSNYAKKIDLKSASGVTLEFAKKVDLTTLKSEDDESDIVSYKLFLSI